MDSAETTRGLARSMRVEASKWSRAYYGQNDKGYDYSLLFYGLEQILLNLAEKLETNERP